MRAPAACREAGVGRRVPPVDVAVATIGEIWDKKHGSGFSTLDVAVSAWSGLIGAVVTDQFFLAPVATKQQQGGHYVGVAAQYKF